MSTSGSPDWASFYCSDEVVRSYSRGHVLQPPEQAILAQLGDAVLIRSNFVNGRTFLNDTDLNAQAGQWMEHTANPRVHRTTLEVPNVRFERDERALLRPLAAHLYRA